MSISIFLRKIPEKEHVKNEVFDTAHSTSQCNIFWQGTVKNLDRRKVAEFFSRSSVDFCLYLFDLQGANIVKILF